MVEGELVGLWDREARVHAALDEVTLRGSVTPRQLARATGLSRTTIWRKLKKLQISTEGRLISTAELRDGWPMVWNALALRQSRERLGRVRCPECDGQLTVRCNDHACDWELW